MVWGPSLHLGNLFAEVATDVVFDYQDGSYTQQNDIQQLGILVMLILTMSQDLKPSETEGYTHEIPADKIYMIDPTARDFITQCFKESQSIKQIQEHSFLRQEGTQKMLAESEALLCYRQVRALRSLCVKQNIRQREITD